MILRDILPDSGKVFFDTTDITDLLEKLHLLVKSKEIANIEGLFYDLNSFAAGEWREIITFESNTPIE